MTGCSGTWLSRAPTMSRPPTTCHRTARLTCGRAGEGSADHPRAVESLAATRPAESVSSLVPRVDGVRLGSCGSMPMNSGTAWARRLPTSYGVVTLTSFRRRPLITFRRSTRRMPLTRHHAIGDESPSRTSGGWCETRWSEPLPVTSATRKRDEAASRRDTDCSPQPSRLLAGGRRGRPRPIARSVRAPLLPPTRSTR